MLSAALAITLILPGALVGSPAVAAAADPAPPVAPCAGMTKPEDNDLFIRLRVDQPAKGGQAAVDEHGKITLRGVLGKLATMTDVSDGAARSTDFTYGPPPIHDILWAKSWKTSLRPPHLGANQVCVRAELFPEHSSRHTARILRSVKVVDLIRPSDVGSLSVGAVTAHTAKVSWTAATDNYGLAGYDVSVDGSAAHRTTAGTRSHTITGLSPSSPHTVSVVAVDLAGNKSAKPATASFTTPAAPPPPDEDPGTGLTIAPEEGLATASWHPDPAGEVTYRVFLDGTEYEQFPLDRYCSASPCTAESLIKLPIGELDPETPYQLQIAALRADGTQSRMLSGTFSTPPYAPVVAPETTQLIASEASRCAALGGDFYASPSVRGKVPVPAGSTQLFEGCYTVANTGCIDAFLPPSGNKIMKCVDDITNLLYAVSPPGRGPVISGMEGVPATRLAPPDLLTEPITWCVDNVDTCTVIIETAVETASVAGEAAAAGASTSILVVAAAGIGIGIALGVLLAILFPTTIGFAGIFEYPIDPDTDFDTFGNWGEDEGEWYNSLQMYAETVKTTKQLAASEGLPFTWTDSSSQQLKRTIDQACSQQRGGQAAFAGCDPNLVVYVPGGVNRKFQPMLETGRHIVQAMGDGGFPEPARAKWFYPAYSKSGAAARAKGYARDWYDQPQFRPNVCEGRDGTCDEFPFFTTNQAVDLSGTLASLKVVPREEQDPQMRDVGVFYSKCKVRDGDHFIVLPVKPWVEAKGPSFGFRVTPGGTSLCDPPNRS